MPQGLGRSLVRFPARGVKVERPVSAMAPVGVSAKGMPFLQYPVEAFFHIAPQQQVDNPISLRRAFKAFALAYACMNYRATKLVEAPVWIAEETDDGEAMLEGEHPLSELLEQPNPDMLMAEFLTYVSLYLDYSGACLLVLNRDRLGVVRSMYPYSRDEFSVEPGNGRLKGIFRVQTLSGFKNLGPDDVIYLQRPSTEHIMASVSPLEAALEHVNIGQNMRTAIKAAMRHAVRTSGVATTQGSLGEAEQRALSSQINENYAGVGNTGKILMLFGVENFQQLENSLTDLELGPVNADVEAAVCQAFQIHPVLIGSKFGVENMGGFADALKPAQSLFYDLAIQPTWSWLEAHFTRGLLRPIDDNPRRFIRFDTSKVRALQPDMTEKIAQAASAKEFWTEAEQRAWTGKEGGSDELPSERAARIAEEQQALAEASGVGGGRDEDDGTAAKGNRIVDVMKNGAGWRAIVRGNGNGNHGH